jgi:hypothetical protein
MNKRYASINDAEVLNSATNMRRIMCNRHCLDPMQGLWAKQQARWVATRLTHLEVLRHPHSIHPPYWFSTPCSSIMRGMSSVEADTAIFDHLHGKVSAESSHRAAEPVGRARLRNEFAGASTQKRNWQCTRQFHLPAGTVWWCWRVL